MKTKKGFERSIEAIIAISFLVIIVSTISGMESKNNRAIAWFFAALLPYLFLTYKVNKHQGKLLFSKNNLAIVNTISSLGLLMFYLMHFWNVFKPISQTLFDWPALIGFILLGLASYGGHKEKMNRYARRMKFWKRSFWRRQLHKSAYRVMAKLLLKTGLISIVLGIVILIMNSCLNIKHQINTLDSINTILIFIGVFIFFLSFLSIINIISISDVANDTGKTYEEIEREMMLTNYPWENHNPLI